MSDLNLSFRQPFLPTFATSSFGIGAAQTLNEPLMRQIGRHIAMWSHIENDFTVALGQLLGVGQSVAFEIFPVLSRMDKVANLMEAAAKTHTPEDAQRVKTLTSLFKKLKELRDDMAHGIWGAVDDSTVLAFVWVAQRDFVRFNTKIHSALRVGASDPEWDMLKKGMFVYTQEDLQKSYETFEELWWCIFDFNCYFRDKAGRLGQQHLQVLESRPLFVAASLKLRRAPKPAI